MSLVGITNTCTDAIPLLRAAFFDCFQKVAELAYVVHFYGCHVGHLAWIESKLYYRQKEECWNVDTRM